MNITSEAVSITIRSLFFRMLSKRRRSLFSLMESLAKAWSKLLLSMVKTILS